MSTSLNVTSIAVGATLGAGSMAPSINQTGVALADIPIPTPTIKDWKISATADTTESWTKYQSLATETSGATVGVFYTPAKVVVNMTLPNAAAAAAVAAAVAAAEVAAENGDDVDPNHALAFDWGYSAQSYEHLPAPGPVPNVQAAAAADCSDSSSCGDDCAPAAAASSAPAKNKCPTSISMGFAKWFKSFFDWVSGRTYRKAYHKQKVEEAAKDEADADAANAEDVSEEWTMDDPDYNCDEGDMVATAVRRVRYFQA